MLRFNKISSEITGATYTIQIHLMLRFNRAVAFAHCAARKFKYISCYGLISIQDNVLCQYPEFKYISCYGLIPGLWSPKRGNRVFKYISCYGLIQSTTGKSKPI